MKDYVVKNYDEPNGPVYRTSDWFIVSPSTEKEWAEYQSWVAAGNTPDDCPFVPVFDVQVQMWQLQTIVAKDSLTADVLTAIEDAGELDLSNPYYSLWEKGVTTTRQGQFATLVKNKLKLSDERLDEIFKRAAELNTLPLV